MKEPSAGISTRPLALVGIVCLFLFLDVFLGLPVIGVVAMLYLLALLLSIFVFCILARNLRVIEKYRRRVILLFALAMASACVFLTDQFYTSTQANRIVEACKEFRQETGRYPIDLAELVPKYLSDVPCAKVFSLPNRKFHYSLGADGFHRLEWNIVVFHARVFVFEEDRFYELG